LYEAKNYALFKAGLLEQITGRSVYIVEGSQNGYGFVGVHPKTIPLTQTLVRQLYSSGKKVITEDVLKTLTLQGIALWYMDDGSVSYKKTTYSQNALEITLNTYLPVEVNEMIIRYFTDTWGIKWSLNKSKRSWRLRMGSWEGKKFFKLISPYIIESMKYKVALCRPSNI
jgi:hypothetical protein